MDQAFTFRAFAAEYPEFHTVSQARASVRRDAA